MAGLINYFDKKADWEGTAIEKLTCSHDIPINKRIFALGRCAVTSEVLTARIWSFEAYPDDKAAVSWTVRNDKNEVMKATAFYDGTKELLISGEDAADKLSVYPVTGEDLQGEYWGSVFSLPLDAVLAFLGKKSLDAGDKIYMEFKKEGENLSSFTDYFKVYK